MTIVCVSQQKSVIDFALISPLIYFLSLLLSMHNVYVQTDLDGSIGERLNDHLFPIDVIIQFPASLKSKQSVSLLNGVQK